MKVIWHNAVGKQAHVVFFNSGYQNCFKQLIIIRLEKIGSLAFARLITWYISPPTATLTALAMF